MKKTMIIFALLIVGLTAQISFAQTDKEKNTALLVKLTKFLEEKPFDEKAKENRENAFKYLIQTKDVSVIACTDLLKDVTKKKNKFGGELLIQQSLGAAVFKLQNPDKIDDENAAQLAGMESMLRTYEAMVAADSKAKFAGMDDLITKRDNGTLKAFVDAANCGSEKSK